jgi:MbtH protein
MSAEHEERSLYIAVVNHEGQYSIWPVGQAIPPGWQEAGKRGSKDECLAHIKEVWTDMRPLSVRRQMEAAVPPGPIGTEPPDV